MHSQMRKKTISCATDNGIQNTSISFKYIFFFVLCSCVVVFFCTPLLCSMFVGVFLPKKKAAKATDMTIILWITKCNYWPPTKFLIYDQILDPFKSPNLLAQELMNWRERKKNSSSLITMFHVIQNVKCLHNKEIYTFFIRTGINATRTLNFCLSGRKCFFLYNSHSNMVFIVLLLFLLLLLLMMFTWHSLQRINEYDEPIVWVFMSVTITEIQRNKTIIGFNGSD